MICYVMVIDLREKYSSLLGKRGLFLVLFFSGKNCFAGREQLGHLTKPSILEGWKFYFHISSPALLPLLSSPCFFLVSPEISISLHLNSKLQVWFPPELGQWWQKV